MSDIIFSPDKLEGVYRCRDVIVGEYDPTIKALISADDSTGALTISGFDPGDFSPNGVGVTFEPGKLYRVTIEQLEEEPCKEPSA